MDCSDIVLSFTAEDYENKVIDSSRVGRVGSGSEDGLMGSDEVWEVSVGGSVGGSNEGSKGVYV